MAFVGVDINAAAPRLLELLEYPECLPEAIATLGYSDVSLLFTMPDADFALTIQAARDATGGRVPSMWAGTREERIRSTDLTRVLLPAHERMVNDVLRLPHVVNNVLVRLVHTVLHAKDDDNRRKACAQIAEHIINLTDRAQTERTVCASLDALDWFEWLSDKLERRLSDKLERRLSDTLERRCGDELANALLQNKQRLEAEVASMLERVQGKVADSGPVALGITGSHAQQALHNLVRLYAGLDHHITAPAASPTTIRVQTVRDQVLAAYILVQAWLRLTQARTPPSAGSSPMPPPSRHAPPSVR